MLKKYIKYHLQSRKISKSRIYEYMLGDHPTYKLATCTEKMHMTHTHI